MKIFNIRRLCGSNQSPAGVYTDIDFPVIIRTTGTNIPNLNTFQGNLKSPQWAVNNYYDADDQELIHGWLEGSPVYWHAHIWTGGTDTTDRYLNLEIEYTWANFNATAITNVIISSGDVLIPANTPALTHLIIPIATFTPTAGKIGAHIKARIRRIASAGTAPTADFFMSKFQLHILQDTVGSLSKSTKS